MSVSAPTKSISLDTAVATSTLESTKDAVTEVITTAKNCLSSQPEVAIIVSTVDRSVEEIQDTLKELLPPTCQIHGSTSCAATLTNAGSAPKGVSVLLLGSSEGNISVSSREGKGDIENATLAALNESINKINNNTNSNNEISQLIIFSSPGAEETVIKIINNEYPKIKIFGGSSADNTVEGMWKIYNDTNYFNEGISILALTSKIKFNSSVISPYEPTNQYATITKSIGRCIVELDNEPAIDIFKTWLPDDRLETQLKNNGGNIIVECATFPLGIKKTDDQFIAIHAAELLNDGSIGLFAEVSDGDVLTVMKGFNNTDTNSVQSAKIGLDVAYQNAIKPLNNSATAGLLIYCGGLSIAVGDGLDESLKGLQNKVPLLGQTAFGEQGTLGEDCNVHTNLSVGIGLFG